MIRVLVAEDMRILRDTLAAVLNLDDGIEVVAQVADGDAVVPAAVAHRPDVAVVDIDLPGTDGLTAAAELRERCPGCQVLILTVLGKPGNLRRALAAGAAGFLPKETPAGELVAAVRRVSAGERVVDPQLALAALEVAGSPLSPREAEVLRRFAAGVGPAEIAAGDVLVVWDGTQLPGGGGHEAGRAQPGRCGADRRRGRLAVTGHAGCRCGAAARACANSMSHVVRCARVLRAGGRYAAARGWPRLGRG